MPETPKSIELVTCLRDSLRAAGLNTLGSRPLARAMQADLATAHRVLDALRRNDAARLPGQHGLLAFVDALERHSPQIASQSLREMIAQHARERVLRKRRAQPRRVLDHRAAISASSDDPHESSRRSAFRAASQIAGLSYEDMIYVHALAPTLHDSKNVVTTSCAIFAGVRSFDRDVVIPSQLKVSVGASSDGIVSVARLNKQPILLDAAAESITFAEDASTPSPDARASLLVRSGTKGAHAAIVYAAAPFTNPAESTDRFHIYVTTPRVGVRRFVMDMWIHHSLVTERLPETLCCWMQALVPLDPPALRSRRFPVPTSLRMDMSPLTQTSASTRSLHARGTNTVIQHTGWTKDHFRPYRMVVQYPLIGLSYACIFEFEPLVSSSHPRGPSRTR